MSISTADIKLLRSSTGAGVLDCKKALQEAEGDVDEAIEILRRKGLAAASKKSSREANEGLVCAQVSDDGKVGVMLELNCETDFVARTDDFQELADALLKQVFEQTTVDDVEALLAAPYINDTEKTVEQVLTETIAKLGENMIIRNVIRFDLQGEGLIDSYIHLGNRVGVLLEVASDKADDDQFAALVHDLALQIAAAAPQYVSEEQVPDAVTMAERNIYRAQLEEDKKPDHIKDRIIDGKLKKWYSEVVLLDQEFVKDTSLTIEQLIAKHRKELDSTIEIRRFARFELGAN